MLARARPGRAGTLDEDTAALFAGYCGCARRLSVQRRLLQKLRDQTGPTRLVTRANAAAVVAVEVFVEGHVVTPVRILLKHLNVAKDGPFSIRRAEEDALQAARG